MEVVEFWKANIEILSLRNQIDILIQVVGYLYD